MLKEGDKNGINRCECTYRMKRGGFEIKRTVSFLIAIIMTILCVTTGMAADSTRFKGNEITNNEILKTMVCLGVDERSEAAKQIHIVPDVKSTADNSVEIHQATRLINKVEKADGAFEVDVTYHTYE